MAAALPTSRTKNDALSERQLLGKRLLRARKQFGWSLAELSGLTGISTTTISRAERGQLVLSYEKFTTLSRVLKLDLGSMFGDSSPKSASLSQPVVTRAGEGTVYKGLALNYSFLSTQATEKKMIPILATVHARKINGPEDFERHEGEEFVFQLSGVGEVHFETGEVVRLKPGDSVYFNSRIGHAYISVGKQLSRGIGICLTESEHMMSARTGTEVKSKMPARRRPVAVKG